MESRFALLLSGDSHFDLDLVLEHARTDPALFIHPSAETTTLVVTDDEKTAQSLLAALRKNPVPLPGVVALISLAPQAITAYLEHADRAVLLKVRELLEPLIAEHAPRIVNAEFGTDVTQKYLADTGALFS